MSHVVRFARSACTACCLSGCSGRMPSRVSRARRLASCPRVRGPALFVCWGSSVRLGRFGPFRTVSAVSRAGSAGAPFAHCASVHSLACLIRLCLYSLMLLSEQQHSRLRSTSRHVSVCVAGLGGAKTDMRRRSRGSTAAAPLRGRRHAVCRLRTRLGRQGGGTHVKGARRRRNR